MMRLLGIGVVTAAAAATGFIVVLVATEPAGPTRSEGPISIHLRMRAGEVTSGTLSRGWQQPGTDGVWMSGSRAEVTLLPQGVAAGPSRLVLLGAARGKRGGGETRIRVAVNGHDVGAVIAGSEGTIVQSVFELSPEAINRYYPLQVELVSDDPAGGFRLATLKLREIGAATSFTGYVDTCNRSLVSGWALDGRLPAGLSVSRNGKHYSDIIANRSRPDLAKGGLPIEAGYTVALKPPAEPGEVVRVTFEDGRDLIQSPCVVK